MQRAGCRCRPRQAVSGIGGAKGGRDRLQRPKLELVQKSGHEKLKLDGCSLSELAKEKRRPVGRLSPRRDTLRLGSMSGKRVSWR